MDELTEKLAVGFAVSHEPNSTAAEHPRFSQFKSKSAVTQETRRNRILEAQKKSRFDALQHIRCLSDNAWMGTKNDKEADEEMEIQTETEDTHLRKPGRYYKNQLMLSEWLVEVPENFQQDWSMIICPWGRRCLLVSSHGKTCAYTKSGFKVNEFTSLLPGGCERNKSSANNAILDCIYNEKEQTYYILDLMSWKNHPVYDSDTEFRSFWLASKMSETPEVMEKSASNPFRFLPLPSFSCQTDVIRDAVLNANFEIDGLLFYHKKTHYTFGSTPLVVWLKPYMLPEILGVSMPERIMKNMPASYTNYAQHMKCVAEEKEKAQEKVNSGKNCKSPKAYSAKGKKKERHTKCESTSASMDIADVEQNVETLQVEGEQMESMNND